MQLMTNGNGSEGKSILNELGRQAVQVGSTALSLPRRLEDALDKLEQGDLRVRVRSIETERLLRRHSGMQMGTNYALIMSAFTLSATILFVNHYVWLALVTALIAAGVAVALLRLVLRLDRYERM
jgi:Flp pilus assembly protein TadB